MKKSIVFVTAVFFSISTSFADTIYSCTTDTLKAWYHYGGWSFTLEADIPPFDSLVIGTNEPVYVEIGIADSIPDFTLFRVFEDVCEDVTLEVVNNIFEIPGEGSYIGHPDEWSNYPVTAFYVIQGDELHNNNCFIIPQDYESPSYLIEVKDEFETYQWSTGDNSNNILIDEPGNYTIQAINHCQESFERTFVFEEDAFADDLFYAGKTEGTYIHYMDFDPDSVSIITSYGGENDFDFDLNNDGLLDFTIHHSHVVATSHGSDWLVAYPHNGCKIAVDGDFKLASYIQHDQIINKFNNFSDSSQVYLHKDWWVFTGDGCAIAANWGNDGYLGFTIPGENDTVYGWMHLTISGSSGTSILTIDGYAYLSKYSTGREEYQDERPMVYPNPCKEKFYITGVVPGGKIRIYDMFGICVFEQISIAESESLNIQHLQAGIYFVEYISQDNRVELFKVLKRG